jgi:hypothetical protein
LEDPIVEKPFKFTVFLADLLTDATQLNEYLGDPVGYVNRLKVPGLTQEMKDALKITKQKDWAIAVEKLIKAEVLDESHSLCVAQGVYVLTPSGRGCSNPFGIIGRDRS